MSDLIALIAHPIGVLAESNAQHRRIVRALAAGATDDAIRLVHQHARATEQILTGLLRATDSAFYGRWPGHGCVL